MFSISTKSLNNSMQSVFYNLDKCSPENQCIIGTSAVASGSHNHKRYLMLDSFCVLRFLYNVVWMRNTISLDVKIITSIELSKMMDF